MAAVNKVIIVGNLGKDPETRYTSAGEAITNVSIATTEKWRDKSTGEQREATEWHRIAFFGKLAEIVAQYLRKGAPIYVEGKLRTRKYTDKDGVEKYSTEIVADTMQMLGSRNDVEPGTPVAPPAARNSAPAPVARRAAPPPAYDDDIPY